MSIIEADPVPDLEAYYSDTIKRIVDNAMEKHWHPQIAEMRREQREDVLATHKEIVESLDPDKVYSYDEVVGIVGKTVQKTAVVFGVAVLFDEINN